MKHTLLPVSVFARHVRPLDALETSIVTANVGAGNAIQMCSCGMFVAALEAGQMRAAHREHVTQVSA